MIFIWLIWAANVVGMVIVLLNFVIAEVSQTYEEVRSGGEIFRFQQMAAMNLKALQVINSLKLGWCKSKNKKFKFIVFTTPKEVVQAEEEDEIFGLTNQIKKGVDKLLKKARVELQKNITSLTESVSYAKRVSEKRQRQALTEHRKKVTRDVEVKIKSTSEAIKADFTQVHQDLLKLQRDVKKELGIDSPSEPKNENSR